MKEEEIDKKVEDAYSLIRGENYQVIPCSYSTGAGTYNNGSFLLTTDYFHSEQETKKVLYKYISDGNVITASSLAKYINSVESSLKEARGVLIEKILKINGNPLLNDKEKVILNMGIALDKQIGKDYDNIDKSGVDIYSKLKNLNLHIDNLNLYQKYEYYHKYFNASKHGNKTQHKVDELELEKLIGKKITVSFYEITRQIFEWYYKKRNISIPQYLVKQQINKHS